MNESAVKINRTFISHYALLLKLMTMFVQQQNSTPSNIVAFNFLLIAFLTGIASAFQTPTLSLYLSQEIQVSPFFVGLFYSVNAIIGIILSQILAKYSDKQDDRRKVMIVCCLIAVLGCLIFAYSRNYYVLIIIGTTLLGLGSSANPQSFALAREYAESSHREAVMFTTIMRTQISLAWIVGPPLSFFIALNWGFDYMYLVAGSAFLLCAGVSKLLPKIPRQSAVKNQEILDNTPPRRSVIYLFIPVMIFAGYLTKYFSKKRLMMIALVSGLAFYSSLLFSDQTWQLIGLQMLNAIFIGITATIGMVYFQDLMPTKMGTATTLFSNAAKSSWIIGGPIAGIIAEIWHYNSVFYVAVALIFISVGCMWKVKSV